MKSSISFLLSVILIFSATGHAATVNLDEFFAQRIAQIYNSSHNIGELMDAYKPMISEENFKEIWSLLQKEGVTAAMALPPLHLSGSQLRWDKQNYVLLDRQGVTVNGLVINSFGKGTGRVFPDLLKKMKEKNSHSAWRDIFLPPAYAYGVGGVVAIAIVLAVVGSIAWMYHRDNVKTDLLNGIMHATCQNNNLTLIYPAKGNESELSFVFTRDRTGNMTLPDHYDSEDETRKDQNKRLTAALTAVFADCSQKEFNQVNLSGGHVLLLGKDISGIVKPIYPELETMKGDILPVPPASR